ncbi:Uncharacterized protein HZ326_12413 [Fusarium oxysporum f. sp. albedinis]|nr:Uncharacterized protein HZ326_12413 [Fusarium oxysporum f. sp. albedinis]
MGLVLIERSVPSHWVANQCHSNTEEMLMVSLVSFDGFAPSYKTVLDLDCCHELSRRKTGFRAQQAL